MRCTIRGKYRQTAVLCGALFALALVPISSAQAQTSSSDQAANHPGSTTVMSQIQQLQEEVSVLQSEIAELKQKSSEKPTVKPAVFLERTAPQPVSTSANTAPAVATAVAQPPAAQASTEKVSLGSLLGPTTLSGLVDTYYGYDFNHPSNQQTGLRFFDANENQFGLSLVELSVAKTPSLTGGVAARAGYTVSAGFGQTINTVNGTDAYTSDGRLASLSDGHLAGDHYLKEAYFSYMAPIGKGLKIDVGKFVTTAGDEVIETNGNWNYSRSILFYYAIPFYHYGVRATYALNSKVSLQASISNGWNNIVAFNKSKTYGGSISLTPNSKWGITETYYAGPINDINYWRQLSDTIISFTPNSKWAFAINGDYGRDVEYAGGPVAQWWGPAGYVKYAFGNNDNLAVRYEYYGDPEGLTLFGGFGYNNGHAQEVTTTYTHMLANSLMTRFEYRYDFASQPIFQRGAIPNAVNTQNSVTIGMVYSFTSQEAH